MRTRTATAIATTALLAAALTACGGNDDNQSSGTPAGASKATTAASAWNTIHAAVPGTTLTATVTAANDGNHLLGRPNQYTSAIKFADSRVKAADVDGLDKDDVSRGGGIEVFGDHDDAQARANYIQKVTKGLPMLSEYDFVHGSVVMRVSHYLTPAQAAEYDKAAANLG